MDTTEGDLRRLEVVDEDSKAESRIVTLDGLYGRGFV
jgi:hypothetical protein